MSERFGRNALGLFEFHLYDEFHRIADDIDHVTIYELLVTIEANEYKIYYYMEYVIKHSITSNIIT